MVLGTLGSGPLLKSLEDQDLDAPRPTVTLHAPRSDQLRRLALARADDGRVDDAAARQLTRAADRHRKELRRAAAAIRSGGADVEELTAHQANRLLLAAATGTPIVALTSDQQQWFRRVGALRDASSDAAFAELASCGPGLADLERDGRLAASRPEFGTMDDEHRMTAVRNLYVDRLASIVEHAADPLVLTQVAEDAVRHHLITLAGLEGPDRATAG